MPLNPRQSRFVNEYLVDMNGTKAAVRAGYSPKTAKSQTSRLLTNVNLRAEISRKQKESELKLNIDRETVLEGLASAIDIARKEKDGLTMIRAAAEINKMMGYYK